MKPRKLRFFIRNGELLADGKPTHVARCFIAICLVADGYPLLKDLPISEETVHRILRLKSCIALVRELEGSKLVDGLVYTLEEEEQEPPCSLHQLPLPSPESTRGGPKTTHPNCSTG